MTLDKKRAILEAAAKACGYKFGSYEHNAANKHQEFYIWDDTKTGLSKWWNPITTSADTASMCAVLDIDTYWFPKKNLVLCCRDGARTRYQHDEKHDGTPEGKEAAWRIAASMVAAKVGGFAE